MSRPDEDKLSTDAISYLVNHIVLPPKLPQSNDASPSYESFLLQVTLQWLRDFKGLFSRQEETQQVQAVIDAVGNLLSSRDTTGSISESQLASLLKGLDDRTTKGAIPLELKAQNAALIVSRQADLIIFEPFELSPSNCTVYGTKGRLIRQFTGSVSKLSLHTFQEDGLQETLAETIAKMGSQPQPGFQPKVKKAGQYQDEYRDTTHPAIVTSFFGTVIAALGEFTSTPGIWKNTREEVLWSDSKEPWRRSPLWLLLRVTMQLQFSRSATSSGLDEHLYKPFMVFFLSRLLRLATTRHEELGSELLYIISAKVSRRIKKISNLPQSHWSKPVWETLIGTHDRLDKRWKDLTRETQLHIDPNLLANLHSEDNLDVSLPHLTHFIQGIITRKQSRSVSVFQPAAVFKDFSAHELPSAFGSDGQYRYFTLMGVEAWVQRHLEAWIGSHIEEEKTCGELRHLIQTYHGIASATYKDLPGSISIMYLTIMELWVACDRSACQVHPLLRQYAPTIPIELLQSLLLPLKDQMQRLSSVEAYLSSRLSVANKDAPSLFCDFGHTSSFAVKFFDQSSSLQRLKRQIETDATEKRENKRIELSTKQQQHRTYMNNYEKGSCEYKVITVRPYGYQKSEHSYYCKRCNWQQLAKKITIQVYEWPLSSNTSIAKATVFELMVPEAFANWRDVTSFLLMNVLECDFQFRKPAKKNYTLGNDQALKRFLSPGLYNTQRIVPSSHTKANTTCHRGDQSHNTIPNLGEDEVCVKNGLQYHYFDKNEGVFTNDILATERMLQNCTYQLPGRSSHLQKYVSRSLSQLDGVPPNQVIASQSMCPSHMSLEEYKAFGSLRLGHRIQYMNILTQLAMPALGFAKAETQCLIRQTLHQAGISSDKGTVERAPHKELTCETFGNALIRQLELSLHRVTENWESWRALASFVQLATRLLTLTASSTIQGKCLSYLDKARKISLKWLHNIKLRIQASTDNKQRSELCSRAVEISLVCTSTFDIDQSFLDELLQDASAASILLQCSIVIQQSKDTASSDHDLLYRSMLQAWRSLVYRVTPTLTTEITLHGSTCLNDAVTVTWSAFNPSGPWQALASPQKHWLMTTSTFEDVSDAPLAQIHFNLLTAELLIDGLPLDRLPQEYTGHSMYLPLFNKTALEVLPTTLPGLKFMAKHPFNGYELFFGMQASDMLIQAVHDLQHFDLLPSHLFLGKLPNSFVENFIHWYDHERDEVQFRPRKDPWPCLVQSNDWRLTKAVSLWRIGKPGVTLVNIASEPALSLSRILEPLESSMHIHLLLNESDKSLDIELPRTRLGFHLDHGKTQIKSRQYHGMIIDPDQNTGTLVGLSSKLVLKPDCGGEDRLVLIPEGPVIYRKTSAHVSVSVDKNLVTKVHAYLLNTTLGQIVDNGSIQSKLFICYLHALTSHCLPDPFTGYTGTESAILLLKSAALRSFDILTQNNIDALERLAELAPERYFYPEHLQDMQQVVWDLNIPVLSQDSSFYKLVVEIYDQARKGSLLYPAETYIEPPKLDFIKPDLLQRDLMRSSTFRVCDFGAEHYTTQFDTTYESRDRKHDYERAQRSFVAAKLILRDQAALHTVPLSSQALLTNLRKVYFSRGTIDGSYILDPALLKFDSKWLRSPSTYAPGLWCALHTFLTSSHTFKKFDIMMWLSNAAFSESADMKVIEIFGAFFQCQEFKSVTMPAIHKFDLSEGETVKYSELRDIMEENARSFDNSPDAVLPKLARETDNECQERRANQYEKNLSTIIDSFTRLLENQWPCEKPLASSTHNANAYLDVSGAMERVREKFKTWYDNRRFYKYLNEVTSVFSRQMVSNVPSPRFTIVTPSRQPTVAEIVRYLSADSILSSSPPALLPKAPKNLDVTLLELPPGSQDEKTRHRLTTLCQDLKAQSQSTCEKAYVADLEKSFSALQQSSIGIWTIPKNVDIPILLQKYFKDCEVYLQDLDRTLNCAFRGGTRESFRSLACYCQHSPRDSPTFWLRRLNKDHWPTLSQEWKSVIINYGLAIVELQRARRLLTLSNNTLDLVDELRNIGHQNWIPSQFPESLLLEAESGIMIRKVQEEIASKMRNPPDQQNSVMQLNMGEGKSSVIVPMVAAALADGSRLARVIVAKPQSKQMFQMLVSKIGGLLNRRIYHMPFSRALQLSQTDATSISEMYQDCMMNGGILLLQPEHILSFKLMGIECLLTNQTSTGQSLLRTQHFFDTKSRDIVDESDENFSVKFELVYTMGTQEPIEMSPDRWSIIHTILSLVSRYAKDVQSLMPTSIEVHDQQGGSFPRIRTLRADASDSLLEHLANHIRDQGIPKFPLHNQPKSVRDAVFRYITEAELNTDEIVTVETGNFWTDSTRDALFLIRGLIAGGVLRFVFGSKRWRVNFGLDPSRNPQTKLTVPYRSKDSPSLRSEFSHPDVIIVLTSLTYYYGGLSDEELFDCFDHLLKSDQADIEYGEWVSTADPHLPGAFRQLVGINIKDRFQCIQHIFPRLGFSKNVVDYFLAHLVFPKEMKQFPHKLSASGWDIGQVKSHPTTGFSGTNDSRHVLPLNVKHLDLDMQRHTNALVLAHLLQDENSVTLLPPRASEKGSDAEHLLKVVNSMEPPTRVILDVGAQILELNNFQVAEKWLETSKEDTTKAVIFFNDDEELSVLDRRGCVELLQVSPFAKQLGDCLIYLDEAHTRGTDLKLPRNYRAAVTLGANLTKDRLVQACMRMRKLGKGQSVVFCVSEEIKTKIEGRTSKPLGFKIEVSDVLTWAISETWTDLRRSMPLWATQGRRFEDHKDLLNGADTSNEQARKFLEDEAQSLEYRYRPRPLEQSKEAQLEGWDESNPNIAQIIARCQEFDTLNFNSATLQEEQERELSPEIEEERQIERPPPMDAEIHVLHPDLVRVVNGGDIPSKSNAFVPAFQSLSSSSAAKQNINLSQFPDGLLVTADFIRTVKRPRGIALESYISDSFQWHVQWILSVSRHESVAVKHLVVLSPFEANELLPLIRKSHTVTLHLYSPRPNLSHQPLDTLDLYTVGRSFSIQSISRSLIVQLNLFSGQLYLRSYSEYVEMCEFLGLASKAAQNGQVVRADGFVVPAIGKWGLQTSPVNFLKVLLTKVRRNCEGVEKTHMGKVLDGGLLEAKDFE